MVVAADTIGWSAIDCGVKWISGEVIVQTCTTKGSVGDVVKGSLVRESKPGRVSTRCRERNSDCDFVSIGKNTKSMIRGRKRS